MDLAQEICERMKAECEFVADKWDNLVPGLLDKKYDIVMSSLEVNNERRRRLGLSRRYYLSPGAFIAAKGQPFDGPPTLLRNKRIGVQKDSTHADWLDKSFRRSAQIKRYPTVNDALVALAKDEIDAVFGDKVQLWLWSKKPEGACCEIMGQDIKDTQTLGIGVLGRHPPRGHQAARGFQQGAERADWRWDLQADQRQVLPVPAELSGDHDAPLEWRAPSKRDFKKPIMFWAGTAGLPRLSLRGGGDWRDEDPSGLHALVARSQR